MAEVKKVLMNKVDSLAESKKREMMGGNIEMPPSFDQVEEVNYWDGAITMEIKISKETTKGTRCGSGEAR